MARTNVEQEAKFDRFDMQLMTGYCDDMDITPEAFGRLVSSCMNNENALRGLKDALEIIESARERMGIMD